MNLESLGCIDHSRLDLNDCKIFLQVLPSFLTRGSHLQWFSICVKLCNQCCYLTFLFKKAEKEEKVGKLRQNWTKNVFFDFEPRRWLKVVAFSSFFSFSA